QAEDGIRAFHVTGVQTCALPILGTREVQRIDDVDDDQRRTGLRVSRQGAHRCRVGEDSCGGCRRSGCRRATPATIGAFLPDSGRDSMATPSQAETALGAIQFPGTPVSLAAAGSRIQVAENAGRAAVSISASVPLGGIRAELEGAIRDVLAAQGLEPGHIELQQRIVPRAPQGTLQPLPRIRNVIAVGSGKGGVGKSTTAVNLALALAVDGARVGVLDADVYGPSVPTMLGLSGRPDSPDGKSIQPMHAHGIEAMSIGLMVEDDTPMIWRGPMATSALTQLLEQT